MDLVNREELVAQLIRLVDVRLLDPLEILVDAVDVGARAGSMGTVDAVRGLVRTRASSWARDLLGADDVRALHTATRLVMALYPSDEPFDPPTDWWRTPLGQVYLRRVGDPRGKLERHLDGGVHIDSIRARLAGSRDILPTSEADDILPASEVGGPPAEPEP